MTDVHQTRGRWGFVNHWVVLAGATLGLTFSHGPILMYTFIVFLKPLATEFGWQRGETAAILSFAQVSLALALPFVGVFVDRLGTRRVQIPSFAALGLATMCIALLPGSLWAWYAMFALVIPIVGAGSGALPMTRVLTAWFDRRRGFALGVAISGVGLGSVIFPPLAQMLMETYSWRIAYLVLGAIVLLLGLPSVSLLIHNTPQDVGLSGDRILNEQQPTPSGYPVSAGMTVREASRCPSFWLLGSAILLIGAAIAGSMVHLSAMYTDQGIDPLTAAKMVGVLGAASMISRIITGLLFDRYFAPRVAVTFTITASLANLMLAGGVSGPGSAYVIAVLLGVAFGAEIDMVGYLSSRYFGIRHYGKIYAIFLALFQLGGAIGPVALGYTFDLIGSYTPALYVNAFVIFAACLLLLRLGPYPKFDTANA